MGRESCGDRRRERVTKADIETLNGVCTCFEDECDPVRSEAVRTFVKVAERGSNDAYDEVIRRLDHKHFGARLTALKALVRFADKGEQRAIVAACTRLEDKSSIVRAVAIEAVVKLA